MTKKKYILFFGILLIYGCAPKLQEWKPHHIHNPKFIPSQTYLDETIIKIPFKIPDKHIFLQATINREKTIWFMLDTGAIGVTVSKRIAKEMDLPFSENTTSFNSVSGKVYFSKLIRVDSLRVGGVEFNDFDALPLDLSDMRRYLKYEVDGVLGFPLFANVLLTIDYPQQTIFLQKGRLPEKGKEIFDYYSINDMAYLPIPWRGRIVQALIDTGLGLFLILPKALAEELILSNSMRERVWNVDGTHYTFTGMVKEVQVGQYIISHQKINFTEMPVGIGVLGYTFLHHFVITFDQLQKKVHIKPSAIPENMEIYQDALSLWLEREAETGDASIQYHIGWMYHKGYGVEKDISEAIKWYQKAADKGWAIAQFYLGTIYFFGKGSRQDYDKAMKWFYMAAGQGHVQAQYNLGLMYSKGYGVSQNYGQALHWYQIAALQGESKAQLNLGLMYYFGTGVEQDPQEALGWFRKSAEHGNAKAQAMMGVVYVGGRGVKQDYQEAFQWFKRSAYRNEPIAQYFLGWMYEQGLGVDQDRRKALIYYRKAADQGYIKAQEALQYLEEKDTSTESHWSPIPQYLR